MDEQLNYEIDNTSDENANLPWLIVRLKQSYFCINCKYVRNIQMLPEKITPLPRASVYVRGMFNLWGHVLPIIDLRTMMGMDTLAKYYNSITEKLDSVRHEHEHWISTLCDAVTNDTPIDLDRDSHTCNFGKWYYEYSHEHKAVNRFLQKLEAPHEELHKLIDVIENKREELKDATPEEIDNWKTSFVRTLRESYYPNFLKLIDEVTEAIGLAFKEMIVVIESGNSSMALVVDEIISVDDVTPVKSQIDNPDFNSQGYLEGVVKVDGRDDEILKVNIDKLIGEINTSMKIAEF